MAGIPLRNLYVLLAFAARDSLLLDDAQIGACDFDDDLEILARLLDASMQRIFQRGVDRRYTELALQGPEPRGAFDIPRTVAGVLLERGEVAFRVDERLPDTPANRLLRAGLRALLVSGLGDARLGVRIRRHAQRLAGVVDVGPKEALALRPSVPRGLTVYRPALRVARLAVARTLPDEGAAGDAWRSLLRDEYRMNELFESFVRGFASYELSGRARVGVRHLEWKAEHESALGRALLPRMATDVYVRWSSGPPSVLECKYYARPFVTHHQSDRHKLHASHLYQLVSYLHAVEREVERPPAGALVYATVDEQVLESMVLEEFPLTICTLDLSRPWVELRPQLVELLRRVTPTEVTAQDSPASAEVQSST